MTAVPGTCCLWTNAGVRCESSVRQAAANATAADPTLALRLLGCLADRVRGLVERLDQRTTTVDRRLARLVLARHAAAGGDTFTLGATQLEAAEEIGTVREVLVRARRRLRGAGLIATVVRGRYRVCDEMALRQVAGG